MKPYRRGKIVFKFGLLVFLICPPSVFYYKKYQKDLYARGMINDMKRMNESGRSFHEVPKYSRADNENRDQIRHQL